MMEKALEMAGATKDDTAPRVFQSANNQLDPTPKKKNDQGRRSWPAVMEWV
jgi:hypothetical protein